MKKIKGGCLCGEVAFTVNDNFSAFYFCHCRQCQQITGSSNAANVFCKPTDIEWLKGKQFLKRYESPDRDFSKVFCSECGSGLPFETKSGIHLIVPAGSLEESPSIAPQQQIFWSERANWLEAGQQAKHCDRFPSDQ